MKNHIYKVIGFRDDKVLLERESDCKVVNRDSFHKSLKSGNFVRHIEHGFYDIIRVSNQQILSDNFRILAQTENMIIGHVYETAYIIRWLMDKEIDLGNFYGEPTCALISPKEDWCLVGGEKLILWKQGKKIQFDISDTHDIRLIDKDIVEILTDPWSENSGIWRINIATRKVDFAREFLDYKNKEYSEKVDW